MVGGPPAVFARVRPLLLEMGKNAVHCGDPVGSGQAVKACNNMLLAVTMLGVIEAAHLGAKFVKKKMQIFGKKCKK
jgi:3-hydroxyisobutyrate dehydrogenase